MLQSKLGISALLLANQNDSNFKQIKLQINLINIKLSAPVKVLWERGKVVY